MISDENTISNLSKDTSDDLPTKDTKPTSQRNKENLHPLTNISNLPSVNVIYNNKKENNSKPNKAKSPKVKKKKVLPHPTIPNYAGRRIKKMIPMVSVAERKYTRDPQYVTEYSQDIFCNLKEQELINNPDYDVLQHNQKEINEHTRSVLIYWLTQIQDRFELLPETLFLTINIMDRYIEKNENFSIKKYQLVGMASMLIASKYEEIYPPEVRDFVHITKGAIKREDILKMEYKIMVALNFELLTVSPYIFLVRYSLIAGNDEETFCLSQLLLELMNVNLDVMKFRSSLRAACAVYLARKLLKAEMKIKEEIWTFDLKFYTCFCECDMKDIIKSMYLMFKKLAKEYKGGRENATIDKFKSIKNYNVSEYLFQ